MDRLVLLCVDIAGWWFRIPWWSRVISRLTLQFGGYKRSVTWTFHLQSKNAGHSVSGDCHKLSDYLRCYRNGRWLVDFRKFWVLFWKLALRGVGPGVRDFCGTDAWHTHRISSIWVEEKTKFPECHHVPWLFGSVFSNICLYHLHCTWGILQAKSDSVGRWILCDECLVSHDMEMVVSALLLFTLLSETHLITRGWHQRKPDERCRVSEDLALTELVRVCFAWLLCLSMDVEHGSKGVAIFTELFRNGLVFNFYVLIWW